MMADLADLAQRTRARRPIAGVRQYSNADLPVKKTSSSIDDLLAAIKAQEAQTYERLKGVPLDERVSLTPAREALGRAGRLALETGLAPGTARSEDFTPPTRTAIQELGKRARELGGTGMLTAPIPVVGGYTMPVSTGLLALGALQELVHPYREEGENRLWGAAGLAGSALPYAGKVVRALSPAAEEVGGGFNVYPRGTGPNPTPDMPSGGEAIKSYLQGRTPEEAVRRTYGYKPGTFMPLEAYSEQDALEGLRQAGGIARGTRAARAAELQAVRTSLPPEFAAVGEEPFFRSARRATQAGEQAALTDVAEAAEERNRTRRSIEAAKARAAGEMPDIGHSKMAAQVNEAIRASRASRVSRNPRPDSYTRTLNTLKQEAEETTPGADNPLRSDFGEQRAIPEGPRDLLQRYALARLLGLKTVLGTPER